MQQSLQFLTSQIRVLQFKYALFLFVFLISLSSSADSLYIGDEPIHPAVVVIEEQTEILLSELSNRKSEFTSDPLQLVKFAQKVALSHWDITRSSRLILGPYWRKATDEDRKAFENEFLRTLLRYVVRAYGYYDDNLIKVLQYDWQPVKAGGWVLSKVRIPGGIKVGVDYRMSFNKQRDSWQLIDVRVEGISLVKVKQNEFRQKVSRSGLQSLIQMMSDKNDEIIKDILPNNSVTE